jgi:twinkle protein
MARALDVDWVILDHVTMLTANMVDERRELDKCVTQFRTLVQELDIGMIMVSHLTRPGGRGHEDGAAVSLSQLRSSHSLAQLADSAIGLQKDPDDPDSDFRQLRVLKNRFCGSIGDAGTLFYQRETGRLIESELAQFTETEEGEDENEEQPNTDADGS